MATSALVLQPLKQFTGCAAALGGAATGAAEGVKRCSYDGCLWCKLQLIVLEVMCCQPAASCVVAVVTFDSVRHQCATPACTQNLSQNCYTHCTEAAVATHNSLIAVQFQTRTHHGSSAKCVNIATRTHCIVAAVQICNRDCGSMDSG